MYGLELLMVIFATLGVAMSATGAKGSMNIMAWLIFWRLVMGIGEAHSPNVTVLHLY
jgi:MFS transporter, PHS family, inorganic phosphate transporter